MMWAMENEYTRFQIQSHHSVTLIWIWCRNTRLFPASLGMRDPKIMHKMKKGGLVILYR